MDCILDLVLGEDINYNNVAKIHQPTVKEVKNIGLQNYEKMLIPYMINKDVLNIEDENSKNFELLFIKMQYDNGEQLDMYELFIKSLYFFCRCEDVYINQIGDNISFVFDKEHPELNINRNNFDEFAEIILAINGRERLKPEKNNDNKKESQYAKDIKEKIRKGRERQRKKNQVNESENLATIINTVKFGMANYISKEEIKNMTIWELYNAYKNVINKENYQANFDVYLVAGNQDGNLDLSHWSQKTIK